MRSVAPRSPEGLPKIHLTIRLGAHGNSTDFKQIKQWIESNQPGIAAVESMGWTSTLQNQLDGIRKQRNLKALVNAIAPIGPRGKKPTPVDYTSIAADLAEQGIPILLVDIPSNHPLSHAFEMHLKRFDVLLEHIRTAQLSFEESLDRYAKLHAEEGSMQREREEYIVKIFYTRLRECLQQRDLNPLRQSAQLEVSMVFGGIHDLPRRFRELGIEVTEITPEGGLTPSYSEEAQRLSLEGKSLPPDLLKKALLTDILLEFLNPPFWMDSLKSSAILREIVDELTEDDKQEILIAFMSSPEKFANELRKRFELKLSPDWFPGPK